MKCCRFCHFCCVTRNQHVSRAPPLLANAPVLGSLIARSAGRVRESRSGTGSIRSLAPQRNSGRTRGRHRAPPGDHTSKTGSEKADEAVTEKQDNEGDEKGAAITTIFSPHQGHGWRGETRENRAALSLAGEGRAAERREWAPVAGRPPESPAAGDGDLNAPHPPSVFPCGAIPLLPNKPIN